MYKRLLDEYNELRERYLKLVSYITTTEFRKLDAEHQDLLQRQKGLMSNYLDVLMRRIELIEPKQHDADKLTGNKYITTACKCDKCSNSDEDNCYKIDVPGIGDMCVMDNNTEEKQKPVINFDELYK